MSQYLERAIDLRATTSRHYNCAQSVFIPFAEAKGLDTELAYQLSSNFGTGLKIQATCGAVVGGLMALGLYGVDDPVSVEDYYRRVNMNHTAKINCKDLLSVWFADGNRERKPHCDGMVFECVSLCETILREKGKIE